MLDILLNLVAAVVLVFILGGAYLVIEAYYYQGRIKAELQKELGFHEGATYNRKVPNRKLRRHFGC
jgi:hypothetical protein